ncbi:MAG: hypothetical protein J6N21_08515 [Butyrivibrio sp.]|nr:hypothetical protein [Butyrivibrio sp.]
MGHRFEFRYYNHEDSKIPFSTENVLEFDDVLKKFEDDVDNKRIVKVVEMTGKTEGNTVFISGKAFWDNADLEELGIDSSTIVGRSDVGAFYINGVWREI